MRRGAATCLFGRIVDGRVDARLSTGDTAKLPFDRAGCLVVSRCDCDLVILRLPRLPSRRLPKRVAQELPKAYPGSLAGLVYDFVAQPTERTLEVLVTLMKQDDLRLYAAAAGKAPLSVLSLLFAATRRSASTRRRHAGPPASTPDSTPQEEFLLRDGSVIEAVTVQNRVVLGSYAIPPSPASGQSKRLFHSDSIAVAPLSHGSEAGSFSPLVLPNRLPGGLFLFDRCRGVRRWMQCSLLSPLFLSLAVPFLLLANLTVLSLVSGRAGELEHLRYVAAQASAAARAQAAAERRIEEISSHLRRRASQRLPDPYSLLSALRKAAGESVVVKQLDLSQRTATYELLSGDPLELLRRVQSIPTVASAELASGASRRPGGRMSITLRVVYR